jgi:hypothetical protein
MKPSEKLKVTEWTEEEDALLTRAVAKYGKNWVAIAALTPGRNNSKCRQCWTRGMSTVSRRSWTQEEDDKPIEEVKKHENR